MAKRKNPKNPTEADLPKNPEFQSFVGHMRQLMAVPKSEVDRLLAEERELKARVIEEVREIEAGLTHTTAYEHD